MGWFYDVADRFSAHCGGLVLVDFRVLRQCAAPGIVPEDMETGIPVSPGPDGGGRGADDYQFTLGIRGTDRISDGLRPDPGNTARNLRERTLNTGYAIAAAAAGSLMRSWPSARVSWGLVIFAINSMNYLAVPFLLLFVGGYYWAGGFTTVVAGVSGQVGL